MPKLNSRTQNHNFIQAKFPYSEYDIRRLPRKSGIPYFKERTRQSKLRDFVFLGEGRPKKIVKFFEIPFFEISAK